MTKIPLFPLNMVVLPFEEVPLTFLSHDIREW